MCYSDLTALYGARDLNQKVWPYQSSENAIEYPVITGIVTWLTSLAVNSYQSFFYLNVFLLALLFIGALLLLYRIRSEFALLFAFAPAVIASLYINWDMWAVVGALLAISFFKEKKLDYSAIALGIAIATKFFPIVLLLPVSLYFLNRNKYRAFLRYIAVTFITWLVINLPVAITSPGWTRFYKMNLERGNDLGSIWYALELQGIKVNDALIFLIGVIGLFTLIFFARQIKDFDQFAVIVFLSVALFVTMSKVYSPQYVLWLTPLAVLALKDKRDLSWFWGWQIAEIIYHIAIWQHLALLTGAHFGLPVKAYAALTLLRIMASIAMAIALARRHRSSGSFPREFLLSSGESYP